MKEYRDEPPKATGMQEFNYNDRVKQLGLQRLEGRRMRSDLIETSKIVNRKYGFSDTSSGDT